MKRSLPRTLWIGLAAAALMLVVFVLHFLPYWSYQGESASIAGYIIRPYEHNTFTNLFRSYFGKKYRITLLFGLPMALTMVGSLAGSVLCILRSSGKATWLVPISCGILGLFGLLTNQPYRLGGLWMPMVILFALVLCVGILGLILTLRAPKKAAPQA